MITMDGRAYRLRVKLGTIRRSFRIEESERSGMVKSGEQFRDIIGTYYDYSMDVEPDPAAPEDYDIFFEAISAPVEAHTVTLPYGQGTITYQAMVSTGEDKQRDRVAGVNRWNALTVHFTAKKPQRRPT